MRSGKQIGVIGLLALALGLALGLADSAAQTNARASARRTSGKDNPNVERNKRYAAIQEKLDQALANQRALMEQSEALKRELQIIKVRATSRAGVQ